LFVPTVLAVASLVFFAAGGATQFSFLNWLFSSHYAPITILILQYPPLLVLLLTAAWIDERRVKRCGGVQREVFLHFSGSSWAGRTSFLPLYGRTRGVLRR
jgi:hypothetical protein